LNVAVADEGISRQILGEGISDHVVRGTVDKTNNSSRHTVTKRVNTIVNVFGAFSLNWVLRHDPASAVVLIKWGW
jgi:hypothetical protein